MPDFFTSTVVQAATGVVILCILIAAAFYLVASFRDYVADNQEIASEALSKLQEMHRKGDISEEEFRTIQARTQRHPPGSSASDDCSPGEESSPKNQS